MRNLHLLLFVPLGLTLMTLACGKSETAEDGNCGLGCIGGGVIRAASSETMTLDFKDSAAGAKVLIIPYSVGTPAVVDGVQMAQAPALSASVVSGAALHTGVGAVAPVPAAQPAAEIASANNHLLRTLINRLDPTMTQQEELLWVGRLSGLAEVMHEIPVWRDRFADADTLPQTLGEMLRISRHQIRSKPRAGRLSYELTDACPEEIFVPSSENPVDENFLDKEDKQDYCLITVTGSLVSEPSISKLQTSIASALGMYKLIYRSDFDQSIDNYVFKPTIIVLPFDDAKYWPSALMVPGAFSASASTTHGRPTIYVPSDLTKIGVEASDASESFHAAIAHELHHAILDFYRVRVQKIDNEGLALDEGLAHFMEDLLGYGASNFPEFARPYLDSFTGDPEPVLQVKSSLSDSAQGAAQTLVYYLVSQAGGVDHIDRTVATSEGKSRGLEILRQFVIGNSRGISGLVGSMQKSWFELFGQYLGALALDGASNVKVSSIFSVQRPNGDVVDTAGNEGKTFGMRFNNYMGLDDVGAEVGKYASINASSRELSFHYLQPKPMLFEVQDPQSDVVSVSFAGETGSFGAVMLRLN